MTDSIESTNTCLSFMKPWCELTATRVRPCASWMAASSNSNTARDSWNRLFEESGMRILLVCVIVCTAAGPLAAQQAQLSACHNYADPSCGCPQQPQCEWR